MEPSLPSGAVFLIRWWGLVGAEMHPGTRVPAFPPHHALCKQETSVPIPAGHCRYPSNRSSPWLQAHLSVHSPHGAGCGLQGRAAWERPAPGPPLADTQSQLFATWEQDQGSVRACMCVCGYIHVHVCAAMVGALCQVRGSTVVHPAGSILLMIHICSRGLFHNLHKEPPGTLWLWLCLVREGPAELGWREGAVGLKGGGVSVRWWL